MIIVLVILAYLLIGSVIGGIVAGMLDMNVSSVEAAMNEECVGVLVFLSLIWPITLLLVGWWHIVKMSARMTKSGGASHE